MSIIQSLLASFKRLSIQTRNIGFGLSQCTSSSQYQFSSQNVGLYYKNNILKVGTGIDAERRIKLSINFLVLQCSFKVDKDYRTKLPNNIFVQNRYLSTTQLCPSSSFYHMHKTGSFKKRKKKNPLGDKPFAKGVVLKVFVKKPRKPNSANRKCVLLRLSTGKEMTAYVPGIGHNLQEHNVVLVKVGRLRDTPGVKLKCVRGAYDLGHVIKKVQN